MSIRVDKLLCRGETVCAVSTTAHCVDQRSIDLHNGQAVGQAADQRTNRFTSFLIGLVVVDLGDHPEFTGNRCKVLDLVPRRELQIYTVGVASLGDVVPPIGVGDRVLLARFGKSIHSFHEIGPAGDETLVVLEDWGGRHIHAITDERLVNRGQIDLGDDQRIAVVVERQRTCLDDCGSGVVNENRRSAAAQEYNSNGNDSERSRNLQLGSRCILGLDENPHRDGSADQDPHYRQPVTAIGSHVGDDRVADRLNCQHECRGSVELAT